MKYVVVYDLKRIDINKLDGIVEWFDELLHKYQHLTKFSDTGINKLCIILNRQINKLKKLIEEFRKNKLNFFIKFDIIYL